MDGNAEQVDELRAELEVLRGELRAMGGHLAAAQERLAELEGRSGSVPSAPVLAAGPAPGPALVEGVRSEAVAPGVPEEDRPSRRRLLGTAAAAATAAVAAAVIGDASPAAAGTGAMQYGANNNAGDFFTGIQSSNTTATFASTSTGAGSALYGYNSSTGYAVQAQADHGTAIRALSSDGIGLDVQGTTYGAYVQTNAGTALFAASDSGTGIYAASNSAGGIVGAAVPTSGITRPRAGVLGDASDTIGVAGLATTGDAVKGQASGSGTGVRGIGNSGVGVRGLSASNIGVYGLVTGISATAAAVQGVTNGSGPGGSFLVTNSSSPGSAVKAQADHAQLLLLPASGGRVAPTVDAVAHARGEIVIDGNGDLWSCTVAGTPGTWRKLSGPGTAGQMHLLAAPVRVYDSRPGTSPAIGSKTKLSPNVARTLDATVNSSTVPAGATAILVSLLVVGAPNASGNLTLWANGVAKPASNNMVWGGSAGRFSTMTITALDSAGKFQVAANVATDVVIDVIAYYR